jgi:hypothetical protein
VLPPREEREALLYDNPGVGGGDGGGECSGYFGLARIRLPPPPRAGPAWDPPVVARGDFNGVRIFPSCAAALRRRDPAGGADEARGRSDCVAVGADEAGGQVLSLLHCAPTQDCGRTGPGAGGPPCFFVGHASGGVAAVAATVTAAGDAYDFRVSGRQRAHDSEVTDLCFVRAGGPSRDVPVLLSACCAGQVYCYPASCDPARRFSLEGPVLAFTNVHACPIFSMASTELSARGRVFRVVCTGDRDGNIRLWLPRDDDLPGGLGHTFRHVQSYKSSVPQATGYHLVMRTAFVQGNLLVTGTNRGDVRFWRLGSTGEPANGAGKGPLPTLALRYDLMGVHDGAVELLTAVGDVLLSSGGNDGEIVGWDVATGLRLGSVRCHPGRRPAGGDGTAFSCVVDVVVSGKDGSVFCLCRDGSLQELQFTA